MSTAREGLAQRVSSAWQARRLPQQALKPSWVRWGVGFLAASPLAWALLSHLGIATQDQLHTAALYELAFLGALLGVLAGQELLEAWAWLTVRWRAGEKLALEIACLAVPAACFALLPWAAGLATDLVLGGLSGLPESPSGLLERPVGDPVERLAGRHVGALLLSTGLLVAKLTALAAALQTLPLRRGLRLLALVSLCWWIPAAWTPSFPLDSWVEPFAPSPPMNGSVAHYCRNVWLADGALIAGLLLAARLGQAPAVDRR